MKAAPWNGHEGPRPRITVAPGVLALGTRDLARAERAYERQLAAAKLEPGKGSKREITEWSRKSRACMTRTLAELDWSPMFAEGRIPAMLTLTYPDDWETVAPTGEHSKRHLAAFHRRYERAWGQLIAPWKLEFQRRGAPHYHLETPPPYGLAGDGRRVKYALALEAWKAVKASGLDPGRKPYYREAPGDGLPFKQWLSFTWADIVAHPDREQRRKHELAGTAIDYAEGMRACDPKRLAVYFTKHGSFAAKEYQHIVPEAWQEAGKGPGRFWGYWGLRKATATVELGWDDYHRYARTLRKLAARRREWTGHGYEWRKPVRPVTVPRGSVDHATGEIRYRYRKVTRPVRRFARAAGFLCVNNGPGLARELARLSEEPQMSRANSQAAKARRRLERQRRDDPMPGDPVRGPDVDVMPVGDLVTAAMRGETLACGCDAHGLLHDALEIEAGHLPPGWQTGPPA